MLAKGKQLSLRRSNSKINGFRNGIRNWIWIWKLNPRRRFGFPRLISIRSQVQFRIWIRICFQIWDWVLDLDPNPSFNLKLKLKLNSCFSWDFQVWCPFRLGSVSGLGFQCRSWIELNLYLEFVLVLNQNLVLYLNMDLTWVWFKSDQIIPRFWCSKQIKIKFMSNKMSKHLTVIIW